MTHKHTVIPRTMSFIFYRDTVLLIKASALKPYPGIYNALGGHIEAGEDIIACANREIQEESGIVVQDTKLKGILHVTNFFGKNIMLFVTASTIATQMSPPVHEEGTPTWVDLDKLDTIPTFADLKPILETLRSLKDTELFTGTSHFDNDGKLTQLTIRVS